MRHSCARVRALSGRIQEILSPAGIGAGELPVRTGWGAVDGALGGGLARGVVHEWFGTFDPGTRRSRGAPRHGEVWTPPLYLAVHLAWCALESLSASPASTAAQDQVLWIGRDVWPYPRALVRDFGVRARGAAGESGSPVGSDGELAACELELVRWSTGPDARGLLERSLFVDPGQVAKRLWAIDASLRCGSVCAVVADGSRLDMAATRRLQLAAEAGGGLGLLLRPPWEVRALSAATTRWRVVRSLPREKAARPGWRVELTRSKGTSVLERDAGNRAEPGSSDLGTDL